MQHTLSILLVTGGAVAGAYTLYWIITSLLSSLEEGMNHEFFGIIYKPVELESEGKIYYSLRIYRWWGLIPTKMYVTGGNYEEWSVREFSKRSDFTYAENSVQDLQQLIGKLAKDTWSFTPTIKSIEEMKMDALMEDKK